MAGECVRQVLGFTQGIGGVLRQRNEDFLVEEIPLYEPSGEGEHLYLFVEKRGLSTRQMVRVIAKHFGVRDRDVGYAGQKDTHAITRQLVSVHVPGKPIESFASLEHPDMAILWADRHTNKLRLGHLAGNRFSIRVRQVPIHAVLRAKQTLESLTREGVPNLFGPQRFGLLAVNHLIGRALVQNQPKTALDLMLGTAGLCHHERSRHGTIINNPAIIESKQAYDKGAYAQAARLLPRSLTTERTMLDALHHGASPEDAITRLDRHARAMYLSALQSAMFNLVLAKRACDGSLNRLLEGECVYMHHSHRTFFLGEHEHNDQDIAKRLAQCEISPSGPMWGRSMRLATGRAGHIETQVLEQAGLDATMLEAYSQHHGKRSLLEGARRPLRVPLENPDIEGGVDTHGSFVRVAFDLPRGSFATTVMAFIMGKEQ